MAKTISAPWIWPVVRDVLDVDRVPRDVVMLEGTHILRPKIVQVNAASENKRYLIVSDKESLIAVFLTEEARQSLAKTHSGNLNQLSHSLVKLDRWVASTVMMCCDAHTRPMDKVDVKLAPICLQCSEITYVGAENCNIFGAPVWVNERADAREVLSTFTSTAALHEQLARGQKLGDLPDSTGQWTSPFDPAHLHVDAHDYTLMVSQDRRSNNNNLSATTTTTTATGGGGGGRQEKGTAAGGEGGGEGDGGGLDGDGDDGSDFGLPPDESSQDFQTQQYLETQRGGGGGAPETQQMMAVNGEGEEDDDDIMSLGLGRDTDGVSGKRKMDRLEQDNRHGATGRGGGGASATKGVTQHHPRGAGSKKARVDQEEEEEAEGRHQAALEFQTQPADLFAYTQQQGTQEEVEMTQRDESPVLEATQRDDGEEEETEDEQVVVRGRKEARRQRPPATTGTAAAAGAVGKEKAAGAGGGDGIDAAKTAAPSVKGPLVPGSGTKKATVATGGGGGSSSSNTITATSNGHGKATAAAAASVSEKGSKGSAVNSSAKENHDKTTKKRHKRKQEEGLPSTGGGVAAAAPSQQQQSRSGPSTPPQRPTTNTSASGRLVSVEKAPRPRPPAKKLFGGHTTIWQTWGFLRTPGDREPGQQRL